MLKKKRWGSSHLALYVFTLASLLVQSSVSRGQACSWQGKLLVLYRTGAVCLILSLSRALKLMQPRSELCIHSGEGCRATVLFTVSLPFGLSVLTSSALSAFISYHRIACRAIIFLRHLLGFIPHSIYTAVLPPTVCRAD
jgi:hypothetical protein